MDPIVPQRQTATLFRKAIRIQFKNHRERVYRTAINRTDAGKRAASMGCKITGWGKALPQLTVTNNDLAAIVDTTDEWIVERTGIRQRHVATTETTTDLASEAGRRALEQAGLTPEDIDLLICMTITPDAIIPSQACLVKARLGLANAVAFDLNAACSGCIYGIDVASSMMAASMGGHWRMPAQPHQKRPGDRRGLPQPHRRLDRPRHLRAVRRRRWRGGHLVG